MNDSKSRTRRRDYPIVAQMGLLGLAIIAAMVVGIVLVLRFVNAEYARDMRNWQNRLSIVAESRFSAINDWLDAQFADLGAVAQNPALQLYMTELISAGNDRTRVTDEPAQAQYLRNLLIVTAERGKYLAPPRGPTVDVNLPRPALAGIALVDLEGRPIVATPDMPPVEGALREFLRVAPRVEKILYDIYLGADGRPAMGFVVPVFAFQSEPTAQQQIGRLIGIKPIEAELYPLLKQPGVVERSAEAVLLRRVEAAIEYLSPLLDGTQPLKLRHAIDTPDLDAAYAVQLPGGFAIRRDYRGVEVLVTSRAFTRAPWFLAYKIDRAESLAESDARRRQIFFAMVLAILLVAVAVIAVWRHGTSRRAAAAAEQYRLAAQALEEQHNFLRFISDSQPTSMFIVDEAGRFAYANRAAAAGTGLDPEEMLGKTLISVIGPDAAKRYDDPLVKARETGQAVQSIDRRERDGKSSVIQAEYQPISAGDGLPGGVLVVEEDITQAITERERRERSLHHLVRALVTVVDRRDPFAAHHSARVATVARTIAEEMGLDRVMIETAEIAGTLMNLGKILVPPQVLAKAGRLTDDEFRQVRESIQASAALLEGIEFDGPVAATLRQCQEKWDGAGWPEGLKGEAILLPARIVAVANAFVAMVSPRAHRAGLPFEEAVRQFLDQSAHAFDRRVVTALVHFLDNRGGRQRWADFAEAPAKP